MSKEAEKSAATAANDIASHDWDGAYKKGKQSLPWDTGVAAPALVSYLESVEMPEHVLEIGCGTGSNAIWMAERGAKVIATEISPAAIKLAASKLDKTKSLPVEFILADIIEKAPVADNSIDFVFDRGVYHVMSDSGARKKFIERVAAALKVGGFWLCIAGSIDEIRAEGVGGPPQLKASDLIDLAEKHFEVFHLKRILSAGPYASEIVMWEALYRKR